ncbi:MAG TPA: lipopolysaccharide heptosyltransferase family protein [Epsilonproteobacteria bacterium]|nr:lipopolysaccharide heptosyltransferase family protein [Campylobacterota bacterium]
MPKMYKILIIVQRSNGDVLLSSPLIEALNGFYQNASIDLLVNDDTLGIAKTLPFVNRIHTYSYGWRNDTTWTRLSKELKFIKKIYRKYDLSINLTASDRSVFYSIIASKHSISAREAESKKSWWKKLFLTAHYPFDTQAHILKNNLKACELFSIPLDKTVLKIVAKEEAVQTIKKRLKEKNIHTFMIFHPSAQYHYKVYPQRLRNVLLKKLNSLDIPIIVTGAKSEIDMEIKQHLPQLEYVYDFIGETTLDEYVALSSLSKAYIGMDTLNMHIAAGQNKDIFAIFGPTLLPVWSPWSNEVQCAATQNKPYQKYGNVRLFQADMPCVACGLAGCDDKHGKSDCLEHILPDDIYREVQKCLDL